MLGKGPTHGTVSIDPTTIIRQVPDPARPIEMDYAGGCWVMLQNRRAHQRRRDSILRTFSRALFGRRSELRDEI